MRDELYCFLSALKRRGLTGVPLVSSDQHAGSVTVLKRSFQGMAHQRCRVHDGRVAPCASQTAPGATGVAARRRLVRRTVDRSER